MTGEELEAERLARGMEPSDFGVFIAKLLKRERPYTRQEVRVWERNWGRGVPAKVELALVRDGLKATPATKAKQRRAK